MLLPLVSVLYTHDERAAAKSTTYPKIFRTSPVLGWGRPVPYRKGGRASSSLKEQGDPRLVGEHPCRWSIGRKISVDDAIAARAL